MAIYLVWLWTAGAIYEGIFGTPVTSVNSFLRQVFETPEGIKLMIIGNAVGFLFAALIFSISVVSFPMLVDKDVSAPMAIVTSLRAVLTNPVQMAAWALFIAIALAVASVPFLLGLVIVLPVLGHASWHLYRKVVASMNEDVVIATASAAWPEAIQRNSLILIWIATAAQPPRDDDH